MQGLTDKEIKSVENMVKLFLKLPEPLQERISWVCEGMALSASFSNEDECRKDT